MKREELVCIIDDDPDDLETLQGALSQAGLITRGYAEGRGFLSDLARIGISCAVVDVRLPDMSGLDIVREISRKRADIPFLMASGTSDIPIAVQAMKLGAVDFVQKPVQRDRLVEAVSSAIVDRNRMLDGHSEHDGSRRYLIEQLTPRERDVLGLLLDGYQNKMIAYELGISQRTVEVHRARMMRRLHVKTFAELVRLAVVSDFNRNADEISQPWPNQKAGT